MQQANLTHVHQFWQQQATQDFHLWKLAGTWQANWQGETFTEIDQKLNNRRIKCSDQQDKLRWGHTPRGMFTTKEAYQLRYSASQTDKDQLWDRVCQPGIWPKISTFLWLLSKRHILIWDHLQKRGFTGPSRCPNCNLNFETITHLMETCPLATQLWEKTDQCNRRSGERTRNITDTIRKWPKHPFQSPLLNSLWTLLPGFLYWILLKERNNRIFNNISQPIDTLWLLLKQNIQETLAIRHWNDTDMPESL